MGAAPYSIPECGPRLLRTNLTLTARTMLTFSNSLSRDARTLGPNDPGTSGIWGWGKPASHGNLRWELRAPHGHPHVLRVRPAKPISAGWAWGGPPPRTFDPATYLNAPDGFESIMLPGERFVVERVVWNDKAVGGYTTVFLRQEECYHGSMHGGVEAARMASIFGLSS